MNFNLDFSKIATQYLAPHKRTIKRVQWLVSLVSYLRRIHEEFLMTFTGHKYDMQWVGHSVLLEKYLQLKFNISGLNIANNDVSQNATIGYLIPNFENHIGYAPDEIGAPIGYAPDNAMKSKGFSVEIPLGSAYDEAELRAIINKYLIGGSDFDITEI